MITGENYRPLILSGNTISNYYCMGKLSVNKDIEEKTNTIQVLYSGNINSFKKGYTGYLFEDKNINSDIENYLLESKIPYLVEVSDTRTLVDNDIVEIVSSKNILRVIFRANSNDNALIVTSQCNCNCIMCPEPYSIRQNEGDFCNRILKLINLIDENTSHLCISGGEPTLIKDKLFEILEHCKVKLPKTKYILLTNARMFSYKNYVVKFNKYKPTNIVLGIPIYGARSEVHDLVTNTRGSFIQTCNGIKNLLDFQNKIELRIVVNKINYKDLFELSNFIAKHFSKVIRVNIMAMEMLGNAIINKDRVWVDLDLLRNIIKKAVYNLLQNGIEAYLYNFPLCFVDESLWSISAKSISDYKVRFFEDCERCKVKLKCGGFFNSTIQMKNIKVTPII